MQKLLVLSKILLLALSVIICSCSTMPERDQDVWTMTQAWEENGFASGPEFNVVLEGFDVSPGDEIVLASATSSKGNLGTPLVRYRSKENAIGLGEVTPITGIREGMEQEPRLRLVSTLSPHSEDDLAVDRGAAYQVLIDRAKRSPLAGIQGAMNPASHQVDAGLYRATPYDPDLIPVLFVHGMLADPSGFFPMLEAIAEQPDLMAKFQFWFYYYPTGLPLMENVTGLRHALEQVRREVDPDYNDANFSRMVIAGHSLGGLMAKFAVSDPGDHLYSAFFNVPLSQLSLTTSQEKALRDTLLYKPLPWPSRLIFLATPHSGSDFAGRPIGMWAAKKVRLPDETSDFVSAIRAQDEAVLNPAGKDYLGDPPSSIRSFDSSQPMWEHLKQMQPRRGVVFHNIAGKRDLIVSADSSELPGAKSNLVVADGHSVPVHPIAIEEVIRILKEHQ